MSRCPVMQKGGGTAPSSGGGGLLGWFGRRPATDDTTSASASSCPVVGAGRRGGGGGLSQQEQVDPRNQMPAGSQEPWPGQTQPLPTERVASTIPKTDSGETWSYPSPQMFYNALKRKGKGDDVTEDQANTLVAIHNNMNEVTWELLLDWERWHVERGEVEGGSPQLTKFMGRPFDLTPKARLKSWFGYGLPFDRHDWEVRTVGHTEAPTGWLAG
jgi:hypothetical protein